MIIIHNNNIDKTPFVRALFVQIVNWNFDEKYYYYYSLQ